MTAARGAGVSTLLHVSTTDLRSKRGPVVSTTTYRRDADRIVGYFRKLGVQGLRRLERGQPQDPGDVEQGRQRRLVLQEHVPGVRKRCESCTVVGLDMLDQAGVETLHRELLQAPELDLAQAPEGRRHPQLLRRQPQPLERHEQIIKTVRTVQQAHEVLVHRDRRAGELRRARSLLRVAPGVAHARTCSPTPRATAPGRRARLLLQLVRPENGTAAGRAAGSTPASSIPTARRARSTTSSRPSWQLLALTLAAGAPLGSGGASTSGSSAPRPEISSTRSIWRGPRTIERSKPAVSARALVCASVRSPVESMNVSSRRSSTSSRRARTSRPRSPARTPASWRCRARRPARCGSSVGLDDPDAEGRNRHVAPDSSGGYRPGGWRATKPLVGRMEFCQREPVVRVPRCRSARRRRP